MENIIDDYINEIKYLNEFKRLKELKNIIDNKYYKEILSFKTNQEKYNEAIKYPNNYNLEDLKKRFIDSKKELYSKEEVKEYFKLENYIQEILNDDFNKIKNSIIGNIDFGCKKLK